MSLALVRPGANKQIDEYLKNKKEGINLAGDLTDILGSTYGTIIYQEQVMKIFEIVGGYSLFEADDIRVAISKKKEDIIKSHRKSKTIVKDKEPGRNDPCPCGSGKKYKKCCGAAK